MMVVWLAFVLVLFNGVQSQDQNYYGKPLGSFAYSDGTSGDVYAADKRTLKVVNFKHLTTGCDTFLGGPIKRAAQASNAASGEGVMISIKQVTGARFRRQVDFMPIIPSANSGHHILDWPFEFGNLRVDDQSPDSAPASVDAINSQQNASSSGRQHLRLDLQAPSIQVLDTNQTAGSVVAELPLPSTTQPPVPSTTTAAPTTVTTAAPTIDTRTSAKVVTSFSTDGGSSATSNVRSSSTVVQTSATARTKTEKCEQLVRLVRQTICTEGGRLVWYWIKPNDDDYDVRDYETETTYLYTNYSTSPVPPERANKRQKDQDKRTKPDWTDEDFLELIEPEPEREPDSEASVAEVALGGPIRNDQPSTPAQTRRSSVTKSGLSENSPAAVFVLGRRDSTTQPPPTTIKIPSTIVFGGEPITLPTTTTQGTPAPIRRLAPVNNTGVDDDEHGGLFRIVPDRRSQFQALNKQKETTSTTSTSTTTLPPTTPPSNNHPLFRIVADRASQFSGVFNENFNHSEPTAPAQPTPSPVIGDAGVTVVLGGDGRPIPTQSPFAAPSAQVISQVSITSGPPAPIGAPGANLPPPQGEVIDGAFRFALGDGGGFRTYPPIRSTGGGIFFTQGPPAPAATPAAPQNNAGFVFHFGGESETPTVPSTIAPTAAPATPNAQGLIFESAGRRERPQPAITEGVPRSTISFGQAFDIPKADGETLTVVLPEDYVLTDLQWFGVYDHCSNERKGYVDIRPDFEPPKETIIDGIQGWTLGVKSGPIHMINCNTLLVSNFSFLAGPEANAHLFVGYGQFPNNIVQKVEVYVANTPPDTPLVTYNQRDILIRLPEGWKVFDIDWLAVFNPQDNVSYGHAVIPSAWVPPCE